MACFNHESLWYKWYHTGFLNKIECLWIMFVYFFSGINVFTAISVSLTIDHIPQSMSVGYLWSHWFIRPQTASPQADSWINAFGLKWIDFGAQSIDMFIVSRGHAFAFPFVCVGQSIDHSTERIWANWAVVKMEKHQAYTHMVISYRLCNSFCLQSIYM